MTTPAPRPRPHILVVNGRKVRQPVFVIGTPHSGTGLLGRALKRSPGFHVTIGQPIVRSVVQAFARSPSIQRGRAEAAARVLRDAFAQAWQLTPDACLGCSAACREAGRVTGAAVCADERAVTRYGDASPDLMYCADTLLAAFADARLVQLIRDCRDAVAAMLADAETLSWFRPGVANVETEFPHPFFGIETESDLAVWPELSLAGKCAMRWRGCVRTMARLRTSLPADRLTTLRLEQLLRDPDAVARAVSEFVGQPVQVTASAGVTPEGQAAWRRLLTPEQVAEIDQVAGDELRRVGYAVG